MKLSLLILVALMIVSGSLAAWDAMSLKTPGKMTLLALATLVLAMLHHLGFLSWILTKSF
jgi:hypothetical protein